MTIHVLICDDSALARKQIAATLPGDWDINIQFAEQGIDALSLLRSRHIDLLILDLNMPDLDGYGVLQAIRQEAIRVLTLVVSGDIQPQALQRVKELGALDFLKKPVSAQTLARQLSGYGLYRPGADTRWSAPDTLPAPAPSLQSCLQEMANVAMGQATDLLARLLNVFVEQPIPRVSRIARSELSMVISAVEGNNHYSAVCQGFVGAGVSGEALLLFSDASIGEMARLLHYDTPDTAVNEVEILMDMSSILFGAFLNGLGEQLNIRLGLSQPTVLGLHQQVTTLLEHHVRQSEQLLCIEIPYELEQLHLHCNLLVLLTEDSVNRLEQRLIYLAE